ncbi:hypothetical protein F5Y02DRAFT_430876 [Annulohypoxylon stygium]|nr:hypothetical protein F5Y02DRAFT_430876 [Annulohypoxylon stygium]
MSGNAVGFAFQADITNTGSLIHTLTGRALKAMSDGGVDFYAVIAAITLGKDIAVRDSLGDMVRPHIMSKGGFQSVLSKALSIGWGHKGLAVEMANTKAGSNALLLIGALATGLRGNFQAAQYLSELLSLRGCEPDILPSVDVLKHMIGYCAPFVYDLGFEKVLENVTTTAIHRIKTKTQDYSGPYNYLTRCGDAVGVAGGINQLFLTSQKKESYYAITKIRGAWFTAFAAHILGMAVELRLNDAVLWASAGNNGTAIFELGEHQISETSIQAICNGRIELVDELDPRCCDEIEIDYPVEEIFESLAIREPRISATIWEEIGHGICQVAFNLPLSYVGEGMFQEKFRREDAFRETFKAFGFNTSSTDFVGSRSRYKDISYCLDMLDENTRNTLVMTCGKHGKKRRSGRILGGRRIRNCICVYAEKVMCNLAASISIL